MSDANRDQNRVPVVLGQSSTDATVTLPLKIDHVTGRALMASSGSGTGDVVGPASATDNAVARFDLTTGKLIQNSAVIIADTTGNISGMQKITVGVAGSASAIIEMKGTTSGTITIQSQAAAGTYTLTLPNSNSTGAQFLQNDGSGNLSWVSAANAALSNLASVAINTSLLPGADDGAALGDATHNFSDLFLATGAVINYANSNVVITHSSGVLTMGTGDFRVTTAGTNSASVVTVGGTQTLTAKTLTTPVINGTITGTGQATAATASTIVMRDSSGNASAVNLLEGFTTTATAAGTTTLTVASTWQQYFTGATTQTVTLPVASTLVNGQSFLIVNNSTGLVTVQTSGANTLVILAGSTSAIVTCVNTAGGTGTASWSASYYGDVVASGKKLTVSNSITISGTDAKSLVLTTGLTVTTNDGTIAFGAASKTLTVNNSIGLTGTDSTTMTFPSTNATIARTDAGQTFTGTQIMTSPKILTSILDTNGNAEITFVTTASAVNSVQITNAATGSTGPLIKPVGETNVDLRIGGLGTGKVAMQSAVNHGAFTAYFTETDNGNSGTADTIDWTLSNKQKSTLTGNCTFTFTAPPGPCSLVLKLVQDGTGSRTVTWPAAVHWSGGTAPTLTTTLNKVDIITFYYDGTTYFGASTLNYVA